MTGHFCGRSTRTARLGLGAAIAIALLAACALTGCSGGRPPRGGQGATSSSEPTAATGSGTVDVARIGLTLTPRWESLSEPLFLTFAPGDSSRLFVVEKAGRIRVVADGLLLEKPFLDLTERVSSEGEQGLLGLAFSPGFMRTGRFYVYYTDTSGNSNVVRITVADPPSSTPRITRRERVLFVKQNTADHYGGCILFGPDRYLYVGTGDGLTPGNPKNGGQNPRSLLGKLLRLDVGEADDGQGVPATYRVPKDNPFVGRDGYRPEIWALGLRNPWRFSFDPATGDLWVGDVGQAGWEEIDRIPKGTSGQNFGWNLFEGTHEYPPGHVPPPDPSGITMPVAEYEHSKGKCVIGGYVYRGSRYPELQGVYLYGDWVSGRIWGLRSDEGTGAAELARVPLDISSFGEDAEGELYVCDLSGGAVLGVSASSPAGE